MAKKFSCGDVIEGCGWSATASDESELFAKISEHAKKDHNITSITEETVQKVRSKIKEI
jgi:predicted small metal-binding protein